MITKRIIPCLDVRDGRVVKGVNFEGLRDVNSPVELAKYYSECGADELVFYDITASSDGRKLFTDILCETAKSVFIPLTVGGGINTVADFDRVLKCGADKVSVNSGAIRNPDLIYEAAKLYGNGNVSFTSRLTVEVPGIHFDNIEAFKAHIAKVGLFAGGTGPKVRPVVACKGTTCGRCFPCLRKGRKRKHRYGSH